MTLPPPARLVLLLILTLTWQARAQQLIGYVNTRDADITGASDILNGQAVLTGSVGVTARDHTAPITLGRGGTARVCQTSVLHVTESREVAVAAPLLFSLDRGAIEIQMNGTPSDAIMTPDLRFTVRNAGPLDLRMRVARNGDTCVENRGAKAPTLAVSDPFGESMYELRAGQHVLFEHGSLHEVVDQESSSCGCPEPKGASVADALLASNVPAPPAPKPPDPPDEKAAALAARQAAARAAIEAADQHPFPAAISEGLAPVEPVPQAPPGERHVQITDTLSYNAPGSAAKPDSANPDAAGKSAAKPESKPANPETDPSAKPAAQPPKRDLAHTIGHFFHKLFGGH